MVKLYILSTISSILLSCDVLFIKVILLNGISQKEIIQISRYYFYIHLKIIIFRTKQFRR